MEIIEALDDKNALFYIDTPYPETDQGHYKSYSYEQFDELMNYLMYKIKGKFILSCYPKNVEKYKLPENFTQINLKKVLGAFKIKTKTKIYERPYKVETIIKNF